MKRLIAICSTIAVLLVAFLKLFADPRGAYYGRLAHLSGSIWFSPLGLMTVGGLVLCLVGFVLGLGKGRLIMREQLSRVQKLRELDIKVVGFFIYWLLLLVMLGIAVFFLITMLPTVSSMK